MIYAQDKIDQLTEKNKALAKAPRECRATIDALIISGQIKDYNIMVNTSFVSNEALYALNKNDEL
jgi:hypothetical protein